MEKWQLSEPQQIWLCTRTQFLLNSAIPTEFLLNSYWILPKRSGSPSIHTGESQLPSQTNKKEKTPSNTLHHTRYSIRSKINKPPFPVGPYLPFPVAQCPPGMAPLGLKQPGYLCPGLCAAVSGKQGDSTPGSGWRSVGGGSMAGGWHPTSPEPPAAFLALLGAAIVRPQLAPLSLSPNLWPDSLCLLAAHRISHRHPKRGTYWPPNTWFSLPNHCLQLYKPYLTSSGQQTHNDSV